MNHTTQLEQLIQALKNLLGVHKQLIEAGTTKLSAMRKADYAMIESATARESFLADRLALAEHSLRCAAEELADAVWYERDIRVPLTLSDLAERLQEPHRSQVLSLSGKVRELAEQLQHTNTLSRQVGGVVLEQFAMIQRLMAEKSRDIGLYGSAGKPALLSAHSTLDATG